MKKAFSLVELLTVTAIICILAAILFPVFFSAQQDSATEQSVHRMKELGTATLVYLSDNNERFPLAAVLKPDGGKNLSANILYPFPASSTRLGVFGPAWNSAPRENMAQCFWANSIFPYGHNKNNYELQGAGTYTHPADHPDLGPTYKIAAVMNGDLHRYPSHSVVNPSVLPVYWTGQGKINFNGRATVNPFLDCGGMIDDCMFNPNGRPSERSTFGNAEAGFGDGMSMFTVASYWIDKRMEMPVAMADGSAKSVPVGNVIYPHVAPASTAFQFPFAEIGPGGTPGDKPFTANGSRLAYWTCNAKGVVSAPSNTNVTYWCFFRPDRAK